MSRASSVDVWWYETLMGYATLQDFRMVGEPQCDPWVWNGAYQTPYNIGRMAYLSEAPGGLSANPYCSAVNGEEHTEWKRGYLTEKDDHVLVRRSLSSL